LIGANVCATTVYAFAAGERSLAAIVTSSARVGPHLLHHLASVCLHRDLADAEVAADLFIQQTGDDQRHDLALARSE